MAEYPLVDNTIFEADEEYIPQPEPEPQAPLWMDGSVRIGLHTSISGSYLNGLESARKLGANALQIFSASPRMWQVAKVGIPVSDAKAFRARRQELGLGPLVIHANYLVNLAATMGDGHRHEVALFHFTSCAGEVSDETTVRNTSGGGSCGSSPDPCCLWWQQHGLGEISGGI